MSRMILKSSEGPSPVPIRPSSQRESGRGL